MMSTAARIHPIPNDRARKGHVAEWPHWQLLEGVLESTNDLIAAFDTGQRLLMLNGAFRDEFIAIYGLEPAAGARISDLLGHLPDECDRMQGLLGQTLAGETFGGTLALGNADHVRHTYDLNLFPITGSAGEIIAAGLIGRNVSAARQAEAALRDLNEHLAQRVHERSAALEASEESPRIATECARIGIWYIDLLTGRQEWSPLCGELFGMAPTEPVLDAALLMDRIAPPDRTQARGVIRQAIASGTPFEAEFRVRHDDGSLRWLQARGRVEMRDGQPTRLAGVLLDIHERRRATEAISESERKWRELAEAMPQVVWSAAPDGSIVYVNQRWYTMTGLSQGSEERWPDVLHPDDRERAVRAWTSAVETGEPY